MLQNLQQKYQRVAPYYDYLDYFWELRYRRWRPLLVADVHGRVLEAGVGTGHNLKHYAADVQLTSIDLSPAMLQQAQRRACTAQCAVEFKQDDVTTFTSIPSGHYDWIIASFVCCVLPPESKLAALQQFWRVLKPGGRFRLLEITYSHHPLRRGIQKLLAGWAAQWYAAEFSHSVLEQIKQVKGLQHTYTQYLSADTHLFIEGIKNNMHGYE